jgi:hypothetical protein
MTHQQQLSRQITVLELDRELRPQLWTPIKALRLDDLKLEWLRRFGREWRSA